MENKSRKDSKQLEQLFRFTMGMAQNAMAYVTVDTQRRCSRPREATKQIIKGAMTRGDHEAIRRFLMPLKH